MAYTAKFVRQRLAADHRGQSGRQFGQLDLGRHRLQFVYQGAEAFAQLNKPELVDQMKSGRTATFIIHQVPEEGIGLPLTLKGFKEGYAKLP